MGKMKDRYKVSKEAKVGEECICPSCNTKFIKTNYQQAFCKTQGGTVCKDKYWNTVIPTKRNNTTRISPANAAWKEENIPARGSRWSNYDDGLDYLLECGDR